jgi:hypothetical protein
MVPQQNIEIAVHKNRNLQNPLILSFCQVIVYLFLGYSYSLEVFWQVVLCGVNKWVYTTFTTSDM